MNRWFLDEDGTDIYLKWIDDVRVFYNKKELVRKLNDLEARLAEKNNTIENWQIMYESVVHTCHNDKEEIERLNKQLETQENTITNLVEDSRASQEWYKKQIADTEAQNKRVLEKLELIVSANQELEKENTKLKEVVDCVDKLKQFNVDMNDYALVNRDVADETFCEHQDKISFALEQLEKVKEFFLEEHRDEEMDTDYIITKDAGEIADYILDQIKQLKEGK